MSSPRDQAFTAFLRLVACTLGYLTAFMAVRWALGVDVETKEVEPLMLLHGAGCAGFVAVGTVLPASARVRSARGLGGGVAAYCGFLLVWVSLVAFAYPMVLRWLGVSFEAQPHLAWFQTAEFGRWQTIAMVATVLVIGPWMEELAFRGHIRDLLRASAGPAAGLFGTAILFGLMHGVLYAVPLALLGVLFGWLRERTGGLLVPLVVHALHNGLALGLCLAFPELMKRVYQ